MGLTAGDYGSMRSTKFLSAPFAVDPGLSAVSCAASSSDFADFSRILIYRMREHLGNSRKSRSRLTISGTQTSAAQATRPRHRQSTEPIRHTCSPHTRDVGNE
jgi:hypothetical protein